MNCRLWWIAMALLLPACHHQQVQPPPPPPQPQAQAPVMPNLTPSAQGLPAPATLTDAEKKLDGALLQVARAARSGGADAAARQIATAGLEQKELKVKVEIVASTREAVPELRLQIEKLGGQIDTHLENHVWAYVPAGAIDSLSRLNLVWTIAASRAINTIRQ